MQPAPRTPRESPVSGTTRATASSERQAPVTSYAVVPHSKPAGGGVSTCASFFGFSDFGASSSGSGSSCVPGEERHGWASDGARGQRALPKPNPPGRATRTCHLTSCRRLLSHHRPAQERARGSDAGAHCVAKECKAGHVTSTGVVRCDAGRQGSSAARPERPVAWQQWRPQELLREGRRRAWPVPEPKRRS